MAACIVLYNVGQTHLPDGRAVPRIAADCSVSLTTARPGHVRKTPVIKRLVIFILRFHETAYSPITHESFWGEKIIQGSSFSFSCMAISYFHACEWKLHAWNFQAMRFACMKPYVRVIRVQPSSFVPSVFTPCCGLVKCHIYNRTVYHVGFMITRAAS